MYQRIEIHAARAHPDSDDKERAVASGRNRKREQCRKARELVAGGAVLTRAKIGTLNKAEARAYLASMRQAPVRGNRQDLIERLTSIFEMNRIDAYRTGDHLSHMYPAVRFSDEIPSLDSEPDSEGYSTP